MDGGMVWVAAGVKVRDGIRSLGVFSLCLIVSSRFCVLRA